MRLCRFSFCGNRNQWESCTVVILFIYSVTQHAVWGTNFEDCGWWWPRVITDLSALWRYWILPNKSLASNCRSWLWEQTQTKLNGEFRQSEVGFVQQRSINSDEFDGIKLESDIFSDLSALFIFQNSRTEQLTLFHGLRLCLISWAAFSWVCIYWLHKCHCPTLSAVPIWRLFLMQPRNLKKA